MQHVVMLETEQSGEDEDCESNRVDVLSKRCGKNSNDVMYNQIADAIKCVAVAEKIDIETISTLGYRTDFWGNVLKVLGRADKINNCPYMHLIWEKNRGNIRNMLQDNEGDASELKSKDEDDPQEPKLTPMSRKERAE